MNNTEKKKILIEKIFHNEKSFDGIPYIGKNGKPYTRCQINIKGRNGEDIKLRGFGNYTTRQWKAGQEVELECWSETGKDGKTYWNFKTPPESALGMEIKKLADRVAVLESAMNIQKQSQNVSQGNFEPSEALPEVRLEDINF